MAKQRCGSEKMYEDGGKNMNTCKKAIETAVLL